MFFKMHGTIKLPKKKKKHQPNTLIHREKERRERAKKTKSIRKCSNKTQPFEWGCDCFEIVRAGERDEPKCKVKSEHGSKMQATKEWKKKLTNSLASLMFLFLPYACHSITCLHATSKMRFTEYDWQSVVLREWARRADFTVSIYYVWLNFAHGKLHRTPGDLDFVKIPGQQFA